ncbi:sensor histidine kinase [Salinibius halmophilus]|uniref:sensor histidine kinase n=1 Tax=Salinibius halmophilus TaxID=1853216 RepID=UPI0018F3D1BF|nr:histidine kinase [Salinibius halmophilus]
MQRNRSKQLLAKLLRIKLLPDNHFMLWDALAWAFLIYILLFWFAGYFIDSSWSALLFRTALCLVYIPLYIGSFWLLDSRYGTLGYWLMIAIGLLGHLDYWGAIAFQLPAVAFMVWAQSTSKAIINLAIVTVLTIIVAWWTKMPMVYILLIAPMVLIGGMGEHFFFRKMRAENELLHAQAALASQATQLERERIARDLHDVMGHSLSAIAIKSELANKLIEADPQRAKQEMADVEHPYRST